MVKWWSLRRVRNGVAVAAGIAAILSGWHFYDRPAHPYDTSFESCWNAAAEVALGATSTFASATCSSPAGVLPGVGHLLGTWPTSQGPGHANVIFATAKKPGRGYKGLAYVIGETPPSDNCVSHLGGQWWQLAFLNIPSMSCPRGFAYQPGG